MPWSLALVPMNGGDLWSEWVDGQSNSNSAQKKRFARVLRQLCILFLGEHVVLDMRFFKYGFFPTVVTDSR